MNSLSISLQEIVSLIQTQHLNEPQDFAICDNGKPRLVIREVRDTQQN